MKIICETCGKEYKTRPSKRSSHNFCSRKCYYKWRSENIKGKNHPQWRGGKIKKICQVCGKEFKVKPSEAKRGGKFCSQRCHGKWTSKNIKGKNHPWWKGGKIKRVCQICGGKFKITSSEIKQGFGKYCSQKCMGIAKIKKIKKVCQICNKEFKIIPSRIKKGEVKYCSRKCYGLAHREEKSHYWKGGKIKLACKICKKKFYIYPEIKLNRRHCSRKCKGLAERGKKHPNWKGGISEEYKSYRAERKWDKIRKQIYKRDKHQCQICGVRDVKVFAHHIIPWRISHDDNLKNLITVCNSCHKRLEIKWDKFQ